MGTVDTTTQEEKEQAQRILSEKLGQKTDEAVETEKDPVSIEEDIEKPVPHREWTFEASYEIRLGDKMQSEVFRRTYTQKPLSYQAFGEFTGLIGHKLAEAMRGPDGLSLDKMTPGGMGTIPLQFNEGSISLADTGDDLIDPIVQGIAKLASYVPDFMGEAQCIWLRVPRTERALLIDIWARPVDEGGMSMDEGEEMLNLFIEQNYDELNDFLKRYGRVKNTVQKMRDRRNRREG